MNAFINSFILKTTTFLEEFANQCEDKLLKFEVKLRQVDTQLKLIEAKLESVPGHTSGAVGKGSGEVENAKKVENEIKVEEKTVTIEKVPTETHEESIPEQNVPVPEPVQTGVKTKEDYRYKKYFKMIQFGVPVPAIKMKLQAEGIDPDILDNPDKILPDGMIEPIAMDSDTSNSD